MSMIQKLFGAARRDAGAPTTTNREGFPAYELSPHERYLQTVLTNTFGQTYYVTQTDLVAEADALHDAMIQADPAFAADALVHARRVGLMRSQPIYGLAKLAGADGPHFERVFGDVVRTPNDLADFATVVQSLRGSVGGRRIKRVAGAWLRERMTEYWAVKYGGKSRPGGFALRDLYRVYHPVAERSPLVDYILGKETALAGLPQVEAFERLKVATTGAEKAAAVREGRLPHEVVTPFAGRDPVVWEAIVPQLPIFALVRNLATLARHGVLDAHRAYVEGVLTDAARVRSSRILPFRFLDAAQAVSVPWARDALREALELAFDNVPDLPGRVAVMLDRSGSMHGRYMRVAAIFAICAMKKARLNGRLFAFDDRLEEVAVSARDSVLTQADRIDARGGTDTALPMRRLLRDRDVVDTIVVVTDEQQNAGAPFFEVLARYRREVNAAVKVVIIDVAPYRGALAPSDDPQTFHVFGWSDQALTFTSLAAQGFGTVADRLRGLSSGEVVAKQGRPA